jgi:hypothetical protein
MVGLCVVVALGYHWQTTMARVRVAQATATQWRTKIATEKQEHQRILEQLRVLETQSGREESARREGRAKSGEVVYLLQRQESQK